MAAPVPVSKGSLKNLRLGQGAVVIKETELVGDITIGAKTVIHPKATIIAEAGPIVIGDGNLIEEQVQIINRWEPGEEGGEPRTMTIGHTNVFEVGSVCRALNVGSSNVIEAKAVVGPGVTLTNGCVVGALCCLETRETLLENTVVCGHPPRRRSAAERPLPQTMQIDFLTKILPNYHYLKKPTKPKT